MKHTTDTRCVGEMKKVEYGDGGRIRDSKGRKTIVSNTGG